MSNYIRELPAAFNNMFGFFPVGSSSARSTQEPVKDIIPSPPARGNVLSAIHRSAGYLLRSCSESGKFVYLRNLNPNAETQRKYNIIRHTGAMYSLALYSKKFEDKTALKALLRSSAALESVSIRPLPSDPELLAIWSNPPSSNIVKQPNAKLGAAGLGLLSLCKMASLKASSYDIGDLERIAKFIIFMQNEDGSFRSKHTTGQAQDEDKWESLYYPGEAALGLLALFELSPKSQWFEAANSALLYLATKRESMGKCEHDHWALMATEKLLEVIGPHGSETDTEKHINHAALICRSILWDKPLRSPDSLYYGSMTRDGRICPTATRLEGLISALKFLPRDYSVLRKDILFAVNDAMSFLVKNQVLKGEFTGAFPRSPSGRLWFDSGQKGQTPASRDTEIRIDYIQHALCAMIEYQSAREISDQETILPL